MFEITVASFSATFFESRNFKVSYQFADFRRHACMVLFRYRNVKTANNV